MLPQHMGSIYSVRTHEPGKQTEDSSYLYFYYLQTFHLLVCEQRDGLDRFEAFLQYICHGLVIRKARIVCLRKSLKKQLSDLRLGPYLGLFTPRHTWNQRATSSTFSSGMQAGLGGGVVPPNATQFMLCQCTVCKLQGWMGLCCVVWVTACSELTQQ